MMKSKRFEPIQEIASSSANELSRAMAEAARRVAELERQLEQLKSLSRRVRAQFSADRRRDGRRQIAELPLLLGSPGRCDAPAHQESRRGARRVREAARSGAKSASRRSRSAAWWSASARRSAAPQTGRSSARAMMRRCGYRCREGSGAESGQCLRATATRCALAPTIEGSPSISASIWSSASRCATPASAELTAPPAGPSIPRISIS